MNTIINYQYITQWVMNYTTQLNNLAYLSVKHSWRVCSLKSDFPCDKTVNLTQNPQSIIALALEMSSSFFPNPRASFWGFLGVFHAYFRCYGKKEKLDFALFTFYLAHLILAATYTLESRCPSDNRPTQVGWGDPISSKNFLP